MGIYVYFGVTLDGWMFFDQHYLIFIIEDFTGHMFAVVSLTLEGILT